MFMWPQERAEGDESCNMVAIMGICENCHPCVPSSSAHVVLPFHDDLLLVQPNLIT